MHRLCSIAMGCLRRRKSKQKQRRRSNPMHIETLCDIASVILSSKELQEPCCMLVGEARAMVTNTPRDIPRNLCQCAVRPFSKPITKNATSATAESRPRSLSCGPIQANIAPPILRSPAPSSPNNPRTNFHMYIQQNAAYH
jgi:hypothetical protein